VFPAMYGKTYRVQLSVKKKTGRWIMSRIMTVIFRDSMKGMNFFFSLPNPSILTRPWGLLSL
jgi:hypothetical protein